jgi:hypothetical protein
MCVNETLHVLLLWPNWLINKASKYKPLVGTKATSGNIGHVKDLIIYEPRVHKATARNQ